MVNVFYTLSTVGILLLLAVQVHFEENRTGKILLALIAFVFLLMFVFQWLWRLGNECYF